MCAAYFINCRLCWRLVVIESRVVSTKKHSAYDYQLKTDCMQVCRCVPDFSFYNTHRGET